MENWVHRVAIEFPLAFCFSCNQAVENSTVSRFIGRKDSEASSRPLYYVCDRVRFRGATWLAVTYSLFFAVNPGYTVCCCCTTGKHDADVERIVVLFDENDRKPRWVYFGAHGKGQGVWKEWGACERIYIEKDVMALQVYISPSSHAMYPHSRVYRRVFGFANDRCKADGELWMPRKDCRCNARMQNWSEEPSQVAKGINSPAHITHPTERSVSDWERILIAFPFVSNRIRKGELLQTIERF